MKNIILSIAVLVSAVVVVITLALSGLEPGHFVVLHDGGIRWGCSEGHHPLTVMPTYKDESGQTWSWDTDADCVGD